MQSPNHTEHYRQ